MVMSIMPEAFNQIEIQIPASKISVIDTLPRILNENSGLFLYQDFVYFINDSQNKAALYRWDNQKNELTSVIKVKNTFNIDWEDCDVNNKYVVIGDIGNNFGVRKHLRIFVFPAEILSDTSLREVDVAKKKFKYADYNGIHIHRAKNPYDAEGLFVYNDTVFLFTKDRVNYATSIYKIVMQGNNKTQKLKNCGTLHINGLITGAAIHAETQCIALLGYNAQSPFVIITKLNTINSNGFFITLLLPTMKGHGLEAIDFIDNQTLFISSESRALPAMLFKLSIGDVLKSNEWKIIAGD
ncbi:MAG: hypothetical protein JXB49_37465 [Bacteroidales bacterium]|nr:hypothetical protein [Bacteroidales bacterium]